MTTHEDIKEEYEKKREIAKGFRARIKEKKCEIYEMKQRISWLRIEQDGLYGEYAALRKEIDKLKKSLEGDDAPEASEEFPPFIAFGNDELAAKPELGTHVICKTCGERHEVE